MATTKGILKAKSTAGELDKGQRARLKQFGFEFNRSEQSWQRSVASDERGKLRSAVRREVPVTFAVK